MLQISQIYLPTNYKPHLVYTHPTRPVMAIAANYTVYVYENADILFYFNCYFVPIALGFSYNRLSIACLGGEVIVLHYENYLVLSRTVYYDRVVAVLQDCVVTQTSLLRRQEQVYLPASVFAACDFLAIYVILDMSGQVYAVKDDAAEFKLKIDAEPIGLQSRSEMLVVGCRKKFVFINESFEVIRELAALADVQSFAVSDNGFVCYLDVYGKFNALY